MWYVFSFSKQGKQVSQKGFRYCIQFYDDHSSAVIFLFTLIPYLPISKEFINQMFS